MKHKWILVLMVLVFFSMACNLTNMISKAEDTPTPAPLAVQVVTEAPTEAPRSTATERVEPTEVLATPTEEEPECPAYYTETFDQPTDCWDLSSIFTVTDIRNPDLVKIDLVDGYLNFDVTTNEDLYMYYLNDMWDYPAVVVEAEVVNHEGTNKNGILLACYVNELGWYEVRMETGGFFQVYQFDTTLRDQGENPYVFIHEGGAKGIRIGYGRVNTMTWVCNDKDLTFGLNGSEVWTTTLRSVNSGGGVGIGLVTYKNNTPVHIGFESLTVAEP